jgi:hypothetical protein
MSIGGIFSTMSLSITKSRQSFLLLLVSAMVTVLIIDISILKISDLGRWEFVNEWQSIILFTLMSFTFVVVQYFILRFIKSATNKELRIVIQKKLGLSAFHKVISVVQYMLTAILALVILQIVLYSYYNSIAITAATTISYVTAFISMSLLSYHFFLWFNRNRNMRDNLTVFLYGISSAALAINTAVAIAMIYEFSQLKADIVYPHIASVRISSSLSITFDSLYTVTTILGFVLMWCATAVVLRSYSYRIGQVKYWLLVSIPLVYFVSQFLTLFLSQLTYLVTAYPILFILLFVFSKPAGSILFGIAFWKIAKGSVHQESVVRDYLTLAAFGVMLFFVSSQNTAAEMAYPPFGLIGALFVGLSAYLMFLGLYSSAISISQDITLRKSIRNSAAKESELLDKIGSAQMEHELQKRVLRIAKENSNNMVEETGVQPSLSEQDMKEYLEMVIDEIKSTKA